MSATGRHIVKSFKDDDDDDGFCNVDSPDKGEEASEESATRFLQDFQRNVKTWRESLRPGATNQLEKDALVCIARRVASIPSAGATDVCMSTLISCRECLDEIAIDDADELKQSVNERAAHWEEQAAIQNLEHAAQTIPDADSCSEKSLTALLQALQKSRSGDRTPRVLRLVKHSVTCSFAAAAAVMQAEADRLKNCESRGNREADLIPFLNVWTHIQKKCSQLTLNPHIAVARSLAAPFAGVLDAMKTISTLDVGNRARFGSCLETFSDERDKVSRASEAMFRITDPPAWAFEMKTAGGILHAALSEPFAQGVTRYVESLVESTSQENDILAQVAGGAAHGAVWHANKEDDVSILDHFQQTLNNVSHDQIERCMLSVEVAVAAATTARARYGEQFGNEAVLKRAKASIKRAKLTKCETLCARTLLKSNKKKERLQKYTADFSADCLTDWATEMHRDLVMKIKQHL